MNTGSATINQTRQCVIESSAHKSSLPRAVAWGVLASGVLSTTVVLMTWLATDRSYAERAATDFVMPIGALWLLFFTSAVASFKRGRRGLAIFFALAWLIHGLVFNAKLAGAWLSAVEYPSLRDPASQLEAPLDAVVVLGGYAGINRLGVPELGGDGQRLLLTAQLWHSGNAKLVICTGDGPPGLDSPRAIGRKLLVSVGVPDEVIYDVGGLNTKSEMASLSLFFKEPPAGWSAKMKSSPPRVGLVTSAFHMPRALRLAAEKDLEFVPLPCAFRGHGNSWTPRDLIPNVGAGKSFTIAFKETLGRLVGR